ncbi:MAG TPA: creatininase family protein [Acidobacteriota bacterium]
MAATELVALTSEEVRELPRERTVLLLPCGAVEAHGPHLGVGADLVISRGVARRVAAMLERRGRRAVILPPLSFAVSEFGADFDGTVGIGAATETRVVGELLAALARQRFRELLVINSHLEPAHVEALKTAIADLPRGELTIRFPDIRRRRFARLLGAEFQSGACHGGRYETSLVLAEQPELVRQELGAALPPLPIDLAAAIREGQRSFREAGMARAYCGDPAAASAAEGELLFEALALIHLRAALE